MENQEIKATEKVFYFNKPSLMLRIKSMLIDSFVLIILMYLATMVLGLFDIESGKVKGLILALIFLYEPILVSSNRTIGQKIMGLRVRKYKEYSEEGVKENITFIHSMFRYFGKLLLGWISLLTIHSSQYGQAIHDKIGSSIMTIES